MKLFRKLLFSAVGILLVSCSHQPPTKEEHSSKEKHHQVESTNLQLNGNEKWQANPETSEGVANIQEMVRQFDQNSYTQLKVDLDTEFKLIFKNCTMKGEAHDQLHNYLYPFLKEFKQLQSEELNQQKEALKNIEDRLALYQDYFK